MSPAERIEQLKAARRAELKEREDAEEAARESARQKEFQEFNQNVATALSLYDADWLAEYRVSAAPACEASGDRRRYRYVEFRVPGHRTITLVLYFNRTACEWMIDRNEDEPTGWTGTRPNGGSESCLTLADALIISEGGEIEPLPF